MKQINNIWKKGPGKLGILKPLLGSWHAQSEISMGKVSCFRTFIPILNGKYVQLNAKWEFGKKVYEEVAIYGINNGKLSFWSFTPDDKRSEGVLTDGKDIHPESIAFEAEMPAGLARMIYWPNADGGINWAVESKNKNGWKRFTEHKYKSI
ncbi:MAG: hypothetical protein WCZ90_18100 [Melioribacteraceae bacterium]